VYYPAPEVTPPRSGLQGYGLAADLWSAGVCAFVMMCGQYPFQAADETQLMALLHRGPAVCMDHAAWARVSPAGRDLVARLLRVDAEARPTAAEALEHAWCGDDRCGMMRGLCSV
jgi:serine/threonine protein kinase